MMTSLVHWWLPRYGPILEFAENVVVFVVINVQMMVS